jgi:hypothetical protein
MVVVGCAQQRALLPFFIAFSYFPLRLALMKSNLKPKQSEARIQAAPRFHIAL